MRDRADQPRLPARRDALSDGALRGGSGGVHREPRRRPRGGRARAREALARRRRGVHAHDAAAARAGAAARKARARHRVQPPLHLGHDGSPQGLRPDELLLPERGRLVPRPRRSHPLRARRRPDPEPAAALPHELSGGDGDRRDPHRELPGLARALQPRALVEGRRRHARHRHPLSRGRAAAAPESGARARGAHARREVRHRRGRRARAARALRETLRLSADRGVGDDRDRAHLRRLLRAAAAADARLRPALRRARGAGGRRQGPRGRARHGRRAARALRRPRPAQGLLRGLPEEPRGDGRGVARGLVPHRRRRPAGRGRDAPLRRPEEEHHPALGREHRRGRGRSLSPGA